MGLGQGEGPFSVVPGEVLGSFYNTGDSCLQPGQEFAVGSSLVPHGLALTQPHPLSTARCPLISRISGSCQDAVKQWGDFFSLKYPSKRDKCLGEAAGCQ